MVNYVIRNGNGDPAGTLEWTSGEINKCIPFPIENDEYAITNDRYTQVVFLWGATGAIINGDESAVVHILEDDRMIQFRDYDSVVNVDENIPGGKLKISLVRRGNPTESVSVDFITEEYISPQATTGEDFKEVRQTITWGSNDLSEKEVEVEILNDDLSESPERFLVRLMNPSPNSFIEPRAEERTVTILDDENPSAGRIHMWSSRFDETEEKAFVWLRRYDGVTGRITVDFQTGNGSAIGGGDFEPLSGTVVWEDGESEIKSIELTLLDDQEVEGEEDFYVQFLNPTGGATFINDRSSQKMTIIDNESAPAGSVSFKVDKVEIFERERYAIIQVERVGGTSGKIEVDVVAQGIEAEAGVDFRVDTQRLIWLPGVDDPRTIYVRINQDQINEGDETFTVELRNPTNGASLGTIPKATFTIFDLDPLIPGGFVFNESKMSALENSGDFEVQVSRRAGSKGAVSVDYQTQNRSAIGGHDYTSTQGTLNWADGEVGPKTFLIPIRDDAEIEERETLAIVLSNPSNGAILLSPEPATLSIIDEENIKVGSVGFESLLKFYVPEFEENAFIPILRNEGRDGWLEIDFEFHDVRAEEGKDYRITSNTLRFEDGETNPRLFSVGILDDKLVELEEHFYINITGVRGQYDGGKIGENWQKHVYIQSDDFPDIQIEDQYEVLEGEELLIEAIPNPPLETFRVRWEQNFGPSPIHFEDPDSFTAQMKFEQPGNYIVRLLGNVGLGYGLIKDINVLVNRAPLGAPEISKNLVNLSKGDQAMISYQLQDPGHIQIILYDRFGREVITLIDQDQPRQNGTVTWDGRDRDGQLVTSGVYHALIKEANQSRTLKIIIYK